ncbi:HD-GYP domain-containing protein [Desulfocurvibacter africanus]
MQDALHSMTTPTDSAQTDNGGKNSLSEDRRRILELWSRIRPVSEVVPFQEEVEAADAVLTGAVEYTRHFMDEVRRGKIVDCREALPLVDQLIASATRNQSAVISLAKLKVHDEYTFHHSINVAMFSIIFGRSLGLPLEAQRVLGLAGIYHDVGKARIPEDILKKPEQLNDEEYSLIKRHAVEGYRVMRDSAVLHRDVLLAIMQHHERHDGQGYPRGLAGQAISPLARIISLVDVYDALTSNRCYRKASTPTTALGHIYHQQGAHFFPTYVERFIKCIGVFPPGSLVRLTDGSIAVVRSVNPDYSLLPMVSVYLDQRLRRCQPRIIDLAQAQADGLDLGILGCVDPRPLRIDPALLLR